MRTRKVDSLPPQVEGLAQRLSQMVDGTPVPVSLPSNSGWSDGIGDPPDDVEEWDSRDFARWFGAECRRMLDLPYAPLYARDCPIIKTLLGDLKKVGREKSDLKAFLGWTFGHYDRIVRDKGSFTLNTIRHFLNDFLQEPEEQAETRPRRDLMAEMLEERRAGLPHMLEQYGIPLVAAYALAAYREKADLDKIDRNVGRVLEEALSRGDLDFVRFVARCSQDGSPYPEFFPLRDWRRRYADSWKVARCHVQPWWREADHAGRPLPEYGDLEVTDSEVDSDTGGQ